MRMILRAVFVVPMDRNTGTNLLIGSTKARGKRTFVCMTQISIHRVGCVRHEWSIDKRIRYVNVRYNCSWRLEIDAYLVRVQLGHVNLLGACKTRTLRAPSVPLGTLLIAFEYFKPEVRNWSTAEEDEGKYRASRAFINLLSNKSTQ